MTDLPTNLKRIRESRSMSQDDLARKCGLQPSAISHFETGSRSPCLENLGRLCIALNVSMDILVGLHKLESSNTNEEVMISAYRKLSLKHQKVIMVLLLELEKV